MRGIDELDHYELLEIPRSASVDDVERAYRTSQQTYAEGSLATYSVFESSDVVTIRKRLDEAYRVLSDPENRSVYDETQPIEMPNPTSRLVATRRPEAANGKTDPGTLDRRSPHESAGEAMGAYGAFEEEEGGEFDGSRLRRARLFREIEIDQIAEVTKVSGTHLRNIEEENFGDLPAEVYVRGFVTAYAKTIGLDPKLVVPSYMARVQESRQASQRGGFLGRH